MEKVILFDKPAGWTSFDVVAKVRGQLKKATRDRILESKIGEPKKTRVGHSGTLDPFATGLLVVLVGKATKKQSEFMILDKEYEASIKLGETSTTGDPEGIIKKYNKQSIKIPSKEEIESVLKNFTGEINQTPPIFSAVKINGQRAYDLARKGEEVNLKPRVVKIYEIKITDYKYPVLEVIIRCSSGTYIRSLAADIGSELGVGGYLTSLRRTKIGKYSVRDAKKIKEISLT